MRNCGQCGSRGGLALGERPPHVEAKVLKDLEDMGLSQFGGFGGNGILEGTLDLKCYFWEAAVAADFLTPPLVSTHLLTIADKPGMLSFPNLEPAESDPAAGAAYVAVGGDTPLTLMRPFWRIWAGPKKLDIASLGTRGCQ